MCDKWLNGGSSESGILRKPAAPHTPVNVEELLVFGYACKLFRDDEKAKYIDQGKHLIPWMGDDTLKIDRYDVRATLSDISQYEAPIGGYTNRLDYLTPAEQRAEQLCEEERYLSLYSNDIEEEIDQDEDSLRTHKAKNSTYSQINYNYDAESPTTTATTTTPETESIQNPAEVFVPHPNFVIPDDIEKPATAKQNIFIEKTAKFIAGQGTQMEILIKTKQSNNSQFEFLNQNDPLNKYYKYILNAMKAGIYPLLDEVQMTDPADSVASLDDNINGARTSQFEPIVLPKPQVPPLKYKPSPDCTYTQLISKIKGVPLPPTDSSPNRDLNASQAESYPDQFYHNYTDYSSYYNSPVDSTLSAIENHSSFSHTAPQTHVELNKASTVNALNDNSKIDTSKNEANTFNNNKISSGLLLAQYYHSESDSEEENNQTENSSSLYPGPDVEIPPPEFQNIIDKTAAYVLKNGKEFEDILRVKNDPRFSFLMPTNKYNRYYNNKVTQAIYPFSTITNIDYCAKPNSEDSVASPTAASAAMVNETKKQVETQPKTITAVSFSIKSKEEQPIHLKQVLLQEPSSDEEEQPTNQAQPINIEQLETLPIKLPIANIVEQQNVPQSSTTSDIISDENVVATLPLKQQLKKDFDFSDSSIRDAILESSSNDEEKRAAKRAEEKFKDRMAQVARGKLGFLTREKQLQLERKKKAIAFMNQIKNGAMQETILTNLHKSKHISSVKAVETPPSLPKPIPSDPRTLLPPSSPFSIDVSDTEASNDTTHSSPILVSIIKKCSDGSTDNIDIPSDHHEENENCSRSRSTSRSISSKKKKSKKSKHRYSKKHAKKKTSRPRSMSRCRSTERKHKKRSSSSSHKSKRKRKNSHES